MNATPVSDSMRFSLRDGAWLFFAVLIHGCLLFIPLKEFVAGPREARILAVQLTVPPKPVKPPVEPPATPTQAPEPEPPKAETPEPQTPAPIAQQPEPEPAATQPPEPLTAAALVESTRRFKWSVPEPDRTRRLGEARPYEVPENWRPGIELEDNLFDGMTVPAEVEVVDQWVAADGSRNVVLNTPSGDTLCGRAQAWDPLNPLVPQLMMFRTCGGGGKRTFKMPDRYMRNR
jgi:hypothetical protein